jgi:hypothetical protein
MREREKEKNEEKNKEKERKVVRFKGLLSMH